MMRYRVLGRSGLRVSELCLGTMTFGEDWEFGASKQESRAIFEAFREAGGNFIDTANAYTFGTSEQLVGEFSARERDGLVLSTKYSLSTRPEDINAGGNHRKNLCRAIERSLKQLRTDYVDIYWLHAWDQLTPVEEVMRGLEDLVRAGKVLYIGVSDTPAWVVSQANTLAELRGWSRFIGLQVEYSLIERTAERELLPMAQALGLGVIAWAPLAGGVLSGKYSRQAEGLRIVDSKRGEWLNGERLHPEALRIAATVAEVAAELDRPPAQVALGWLRQQPGGVIPILGARTRGQLEQNLACLDLQLPPDALERLDAVSHIEPGFPHGFIASEPLRRALFGEHLELLDA
jgi:aryl-alcohol dehydrogenase-like predicted oxidoreductase